MCSCIVSTGCDTACDTVAIGCDTTYSYTGYTHNQQYNYLHLTCCMDSTYKAQAGRNESADTCCDLLRTHLIYPTTNKCSTTKYRQEEMPWHIYQACTTKYRHLLWTHLSGCVQAGGNKCAHLWLSLQMEIIMQAENVLPTFHEAELSHTIIPTH